MNTSASPRRSRIVLVEDHLMFREQLAHLIGREEDMIVCGQTDNIGDGVALIEETHPDLAIIDISLRGSSGLELLKDLRARQIDVPALILSMHGESLYAERALRAGAKGYITKHEASAKVMIAIRQVLAGEIYLEPRFMSRVVSKIVRQDDEHVRDPVDRLTDRELEVFELIGRGCTTREIGARLRLGLTTIDTYRARIKDKLALENAARLHSEAARWLEQREVGVSI